MIHHKYKQKTYYAKPHKENSGFCILQFTFNSSFYIKDMRPIQGAPNRTIFLDRIKLILYEQDAVNAISTMLIS